ncbi:hypothetical protein Bca4012_103155 [Brassica carinata]
MKGEQLRKHLPRMFSLIKKRKLGARRRSDTALVSTISDADQGSAVVAFRTPLAPYDKSKFLGSGGSMVARLKLNGIDGWAPPGVVPAAFFVSTRESVNHRVFERKLRPKPSGEARLPGCHKSSSPSSRGYGTEAGLRVLPHAVGQNRAKGARASRHAVVNSSLVISSVVRSEALDDPKSSTRPQVRRDHPLSLSISISGGKETNKDSLSNGERTGRAQLENRASWRRIVVWRSVLSDGPGPSSLERGAREGESPSFGPCRTTQALSESGCLGMQPQSGESQRVLEIVGREADGAAMRPGRMRAEQSGPPIDSVVDRRGLRRWPKPGFCYASGGVAALIVVCSTRLTACLGICVLRASACGLPIRPVLKHGPRSLTCVRVSG